MSPRRKLKINRPTQLPTCLPPAHPLVSHTRHVQISSYLPTQTCSSSPPHFNKWHLHYSSCSGQKLQCYPWLHSFSLHSSHPSVNYFSPTWVKFRTQPLLITSTIAMITSHLHYHYNPPEYLHFHFHLCLPHPTSFYSLYSRVLSFTNMSDQNPLNHLVASYLTLFTAVCTSRVRTGSAIYKALSERCWLVMKEKWPNQSQIYNKSSNVH